MTDTTHIAELEAELAGTEDALALAIKDRDETRERLAAFEVAAKAVGLDIGGPSNET